MFFLREILLILFFSPKCVVFYIEWHRKGISICKMSTWEVPFIALFDGFFKVGFYLNLSEIMRGLKKG